MGTNLHAIVEMFDTPNKKYHDVSSWEFNKCGPLQEAIYEASKAGLFVEGWPAPEMYSIAARMVKEDDISLSYYWTGVAQLRDFLRVKTKMGGDVSQLHPLLRSLVASLADLEVLGDVRILFHTT